MRQFFRVVSLVVGLAVFGDLAHAHHSQAGIFDSERQSRSPASSSLCRGATRMDRSSCP